MYPNNFNYLHVQRKDHGHKSFVVDCNLTSLTSIVDSERLRQRLNFIANIVVQSCTKYNLNEGPVKKVLVSSICINKHIRKGSSENINLRDIS